MWINDKVIYTPEIIEKRHGKAVEAIVESVGTDGSLGLLLPDGVAVRVDSKNCKLITA